MRFVVRYFDALVEPLFKQDRHGRTLFFPAGMWWRGFVLPDAAVAARLRRRARLAYVVVFAVLIPLVVWSGRAGASSDLQAIGSALVAGLVLGALNVAWLWALVRGYPRSDERLGWGEASTTQARVLGRGWLVALLAVSLLLTSGSLLALVLDPARNLVAAIAGVLMFGACSLVFWRQLTAARTARRD